MTVHMLKTWPNAWDAVAAGEKTFEVRKNDRFFQRGDEVVLHRFDPSPGKSCYVSPDNIVKSTYPQEQGTLRFRVGWMLQGGLFGIEPGYCVFSLEPLDSAIRL